MFSKIPGLRGILEAIYTDVSKDISDKSWHVPQLWKIQNLKTLTNPNWIHLYVHVGDVVSMSGPYTMYGVLFQHIFF